MYNNNRNEMTLLHMNEKLQFSKCHIQGEIGTLKR